MISVNDIMVGDYLTFEECVHDDGFPILKVDGIIPDTIFAQIDDSEADDEIDYEDLVGIPITPAILEKNGWFYKNGFHTKKGPVRLSWKEDGTLIVGYFQFPCAVEFVHILQNILRILGLEDIAI